jgi:hypothetical protein
MPPRRTSSVPVDPADLRARLEAGKIVRVRVRPSAQFPDGALGRVRRVGDPAVDGDEYISVEVPLATGKDVVPFPPGDLSDPAAAGPAAGRPAARSAAARPSGPRAAADGPRRLRPVPPLTGGPDPVAGPDRAAATGVLAGTGIPAATGDPTATGAPAAGAAAQAVAASVVPARSGPSEQVPSKEAESAAASGSRPATPKGAARPAGKRGSRPPVTITLSTDPDGAGGWKVEARVGARAVVRPTPVSPARVWDMVQGLENEQLTGAVQAHLAEHRRAAQQRADELAAQLAAVRAELDTLPPSP